MPDIALVHLARYANGPEVFARFFASYRRHPAGIDHHLFVVCKGFPQRSVPAEYAKELDNLSPRFLFLSDRGYDIGSYRKAAESFTFPFYCFVNSFSAICNDGWLGKLHRHVVEPGVGLAGTTGSWESITTNLEDLLYQEKASLIQRLRLAWLRRFFPPFPNPHVRTNGFMISSELFSRIRTGIHLTKIGALGFESGFHSLTRQSIRLGYRPVIVGRDGHAYHQDKWPDSHIFRTGEEENLLISDNRTNDYLVADASQRALLTRYAWGPRASEKPADLR